MSARGTGTGRRKEGGAPAPTLQQRIARVIVRCERFLIRDRADHATRSPGVANASRRVEVHVQAMLDAAVEAKGAFVLAKHVSDAELMLTVLEAFEQSAVVERALATKRKAA